MSVVPGDDGVPDVARIDGYFLGGSHDFAADRQRARETVRTVHEIAHRRDPSVVVAYVDDERLAFPASEQPQREAIRHAGGPAYPVHLRSRAAIVAMMEQGGFTVDADGPVEFCRRAVPARAEPLGAYAVISEPLS